MASTFCMMEVARTQEPPLDVVLVDDVCTTRDSTVKAIHASREAG